MPTQLVHSQSLALKTDSETDLGSWEWQVSYDLPFQTRQADVRTQTPEYQTEFAL
jgi:hypothetical protein